MIEMHLSFLYNRFMHVLLQFVIERMEDYEKRIEWTNYIFNGNDNDICLFSAIFNTR